jgi:hypothetical protein
MANYYLVLSLTLLKLYTSGVVYGIFTLELLAWGFLTRETMSRPLARNLGVLQDKLCSIADRVKERTGKAESAAAVMAFFALLFFAVNLFSTAGQIFDGWDDVVSWNRWALDWYSGRLPSLTWHYPQLLPANWSLTYVFMADSQVQFFAKMPAPAFPLFIMLGLTDLWLSKKQTAYLYAIPITAVLIVTFAGHYLNKGYADLPVAFMSFVALYLLLLCDGSTPQAEQGKNLLYGAACCAGAALTKQAGLYLLAVYPLLCYFLVLNRPGAADKLWQAARLYAISLVLTAPWYLFAEANIRKGADRSERSFAAADIMHSVQGSIANMTAAVAGLRRDIASLAAPLADEAVIAVEALLCLILAILVCCTLMSVRDRIGKYLVGLVVLPFTVSWCLFFSYDFRNLCFVLPIIGIAAGYGLANSKLGAGKC